MEAVVGTGAASTRCGTSRHLAVAVPVPAAGIACVLAASGKARQVAVSGSPGIPRKLRGVHTVIGGDRHRGTRQP